MATVWIINAIRSFPILGNISSTQGFKLQFGWRNRSKGELSTFRHLHLFSGLP